MKILFSLLFISASFLGCYGQPAKTVAHDHSKILPGAERIDTYLPLLKNKKVGLFANQTSIVGNTHLVDTLQKLGINVTVIFGPEHGFRGHC